MKHRGFASFITVSATYMSWLAIALVIIIAGLDLVGWLLDIPLLKSVNPHFTTMRIITAICFLLSAAALTCLHGNRFVRWRKSVTLLSGTVVSAVGLLTIASYLIELYTGSQFSWMNNKFLDFFLVPPSRMSIITSILFSLYGCVLLMLGAGDKRAAEASHAILLPVSMLSYLVIIGYLFDIKSLYTWLNLSIALNTSLGFWCLCVAAFCVRPNSWFMKVFTGEEFGSILSRRLLPFLLFLPLLIGWLRLQGERLGFFGSEVGVAIVVVTYTFCFILLVWLNARSINRTDLLRRKAEAALREKEKMLNRAEEIAHLGSWELDLVNNVISWSDEVYHIFGLKPDEFGASYEAFIDAVHPDDRADVDAAYSSSLREDKEFYEIEHRIIRKSTGEIRFVHEKCDHIRDKNGKVIRSIGMVQDITERKKTDEELKRAKNELEIRIKERTAALKKTMINLDIERNRFNHVLEIMPAYVVLLTPGHRVKFANRFFTQRFGEQDDSRCFKFLFGRTEPCENCETYKVLTTHKPHRWEWTGPDHRIYDVYDFFFPDADGSPAIMEMGIDISDRKKAEAALLEANEMKLLGQLTSGVAHEVRNPLNGIMAIMGALSKELSDDDRFQPYMQHMRKQITRLTTLMEELLTLGRPLREENMHEISMVPFVENALSTWLQTSHASMPVVRFVKPEKPEQFLIWADSTNMTQVLINLFENAFNHSPEGAEIVCSIHGQIANMLVFSIKDSGTGIQAEILRKIFDPFFTTRKGGTGLGLSIVRHIVENHHGRVFAYNNTDGPGATFDVLLPLYTRN